MIPMIGKNRKKGCAPCRTESELKRKKKKRTKNGLVSHCILTNQVKASLRQREGGSYLHTQGNLSMPSQQVGRLQ